MSPHQARNLEAVPDERAPRPRRRRWIGIAVSIVLIVAVFGFLLPKLADYADVWDVVQGLDSWDIIALTAVGVWNLFALAPLVMTAQPVERVDECDEIARHEPGALVDQLIE